MGFPARVCLVIFSAAAASTCSHGRSSFKGPPARCVVVLMACQVWMEEDGEEEEVKRGRRGVEEG